MRRFLVADAEEIWPLWWSQSSELDVWQEGKKDSYVVCSGKYNNLNAEMMKQLAQGILKEEVLC